MKLARRQYRVQRSVFGNNTVERNKLQRRDNNGKPRDAHSTARWKVPGVGRACRFVAGGIHILTVVGTCGLGGADGSWQEVRQIFKMMKSNVDVLLNYSGDRDAFSSSNANFLMGLGQPLCSASADMTAVQKGRSQVSIKFQYLTTWFKTIRFICKYADTL